MLKFGVGVWDACIPNEAENAGLDASMAILFLGNGVVVDEWYSEAEAFSKRKRFEGKEEISSLVHGRCMTPSGGIQQLYLFRGAGAGCGLTHGTKRRLLGSTAVNIISQRTWMITAQRRQKGQEQRGGRNVQRKEKKE